MANKTVIKILTENGLKVTPQRTAVLEVILGLDNHPTAENIAEYLRLNFPHIPIGTVYRILETFISKGIIKRVNTKDDIIRFDPVKENHHHLYHSDSERIQDLYDDELNKLLENYFKKKKIPDFSIEEIKVQVTGKYINNKK
jgi:Fur family peroxide stress response transcriptional regulator